MKWDVDTEGGGQCYPAGAYKVSPKEIVEVEAKSGNMQLKIKAVILEGEYKGKHIVDHLTLVDSCMWKLVKFIKAMGVNVEKLESMDTESGAFRAVINKCIGKTVFFVLEIKPSYNDPEKETNEVVDYVEDESQSADDPAFLNKDKGEVDPNWPDEEQSA